MITLFNRIKKVEIRYTETKTFENKYWTGKKKGKKSSLSAYGTKRKSDFGKT